MHKSYITACTNTVTCLTLNTYVQSLKYLCNSAKQLIEFCTHTDHGILQNIIYEYSNIKPKLLNSVQPLLIHPAAIVYARFDFNIHTTLRLYLYNSSRGWRETNFWRIRLKILVPQKCKITGYRNGNCCESKNSLSLRQLLPQRSTSCTDGNIHYGSQRNASIYLHYLKWVRNHPLRRFFPKTTAGLIPVPMKSKWRWPCLLPSLPAYRVC